MQVLCGDIGGTKTRIALIDVLPSGLEVEREETFRSTKYDSLDAIVHEFLSGTATALKPTCGGFGIAGPVRNGRSETTNLPWLVDSRELEESLNLSQVYLTNDLEATAWGIGALNDSDFYELHPGTPDPCGNISVIAAGTGLGEAGICRVNGTARPFSSEGGHSDFAPATELEFALRQFLSRRFGHVSWERVVSGMGIAHIYRFLCEYEQADTPAWLEDQFVRGDAAAIISRTADSGRCGICAKTMDLFVHLYGREAGNHALKLLATGGVHLGGGIAPKILARLKTPAFLQAFFAKGRMEPLMRSMPVRVILNGRAALYGAALAAVKNT